MHSNRKCKRESLKEMLISVIIPLPKSKAFSTPATECKREFPKMVLVSGYPLIVIHTGHKCKRASVKEVIIKAWPALAEIKSVLDMTGRPQM